MDNVSRACRIMGYSRQQFYEIRRNYQTYGADDLIDRLSRRKRWRHSTTPSGQTRCGPARSDRATAFFHWGVPLSHFPRFQLLDVPVQGALASRPFATELEGR